MSWHQNDQPLWIYMWRHQVLLTLSSCADPVIKDDRQYYRNDTLKMSR